MSHLATSSASAESPRLSARRLPLSGVLTLISIVALAVLVLDQISKNWAESSLSPWASEPLVGSFLQLTLVYNSGAAFGLGSAATPIITIVQILIAIAVVVFAVRSVRSRWFALALALVLGGALGNIHDRLLRPPSPFRGEVVDFLQLPNWPVFNVADIAVVTGAAMVVLFSLLGMRTDPQHDPSDTTDSTTDSGHASTQENAREH